MRERRTAWRAKLITVKLLNSGEIKNKTQCSRPSVSPVSIFSPSPPHQPPLYLLHSASECTKPPFSPGIQRKVPEKARRSPQSWAFQGCAIPASQGEKGRAGFRLQVWINKLLRALTRTSWSRLRSCFCSQTPVVGFIPPLLCLAQYVNTRLEMVDSSQSPEIISLTSGVQ